MPSWKYLVRQQLYLTIYALSPSPPIDRRRAKRFPNSLHPIKRWTCATPTALPDTPTTLLVDPRKIQQPLLALPVHPDPPIGLPRQTLPRHVAVRLDVLDETVLAHVVVLGPDEAEDEQVERGGVEVGREGVQDVDLDAAHGVFVERVVADGQDGVVDVGRRCRCRRRRGRCGGRGGVVGRELQGDKTVVDPRGQVRVG